MGAAFGGEVSVIPWANYESADWGKYSVTVDAERSMSNEELTIIVKGIEGDFMIDHILLTSSLNTEGCKSSVDLEFTPDVENTAGGTSDGASDGSFGGAENHVDGNRVISVHFAPINKNQQNFINVNSKIDFKAKGDKKMKRKKNRRN